MRRAAVLVALLWAVPASASVDELAPKPRARVLHVQDAASGKPLGSVELRGVSAESDEFIGRTDAEGEAKLPKLLPAWEFLKVGKAGYGTVLVDSEDVETYFAGTYHTYSKHYDGFAGTIKLEAER